MFARRKILFVTLAIALALLGSGILPSAAQAQTTAVHPSMKVTLLSNGSISPATVSAGSPLTFEAQIKNTGDVPLQVLGTVALPAGWSLVDGPYNSCPSQLAVNETCTISWGFIPGGSGQVYLWAYIKAIYTLPSGVTNRFTVAPRFIFNVASAGQAQGSSSVAASTGSNSLPAMKVTLLANDVAGTSATLYAGQPLSFRARVQNTGHVPLQILAHLNVPQGWDVDEDPYSDCPDQLAVNGTCTISWKFTPQVRGQVYLWTYVKAIYTLPSGVTSRFTVAPQFIFNVQPPRGQ